MIFQHFNFCDSNCESKCKGHRWRWTYFLAESVAEAQRYASKELKEMEEKKKSKKRKNTDFDDSEQFVGVRDRIGGGGKKGGKKDGKNGKKFKRR